MKPDVKRKRIDEVNEQMTAQAKQFIEKYENR